jgi:hypothetical protein
VESGHLVANLKIRCRAKGPIATEVIVRKKDFASFEELIAEARANVTLVVAGAAVAAPFLVKN